jgi:hypothetical protein
MLTLPIRWPFAELILRWIKTVELRATPTLAGTPHLDSEMWETISLNPPPLVPH